MKVQLSPWDVTETSVRLPLPTKRRRRSDSAPSEDATAATPGSSTAPLPLAVSLVRRSGGDRSPGKRPKGPRQRGSSALARAEEMEPAAVVTLSHQITVLCRNTPTDGDDDTTFSLEESAVLQYSSRPGPAQSFLPAAGDDSAAIAAPAALLDVRRDRVYALQADGCRLLGWAASSGGPDRGAVGVRLRSAARSLSLLHLVAGPALLYGTCRDGALFLAREAAASEAGGAAGVWLVEYLPGAPSANESTTRFRHLYTTIQSDVADGGPSLQPGTKRKMEPANGDTSTLKLSIHQLFFDAKNSKLVMQKRSLPFIRWHCTRGERFLKDGEDFPVHTVALPLNLRRGSTRIEDLQCVGASQDASALVMRYTFKHGCAQARQFFQSIALGSGCAQSPPFEIASTARHVGILGSSYMIALTQSELHLYDRRRGAHLCSSDAIPFTVQGSASLISDASSNDFALLGTKDDRMFVATCSVKIDDSVPRYSPLSLAETYSIAHNNACFNSFSGVMVYDLEFPQRSPHDCQSRVENACSVFRKSVDEILSSRKAQLAESCVCDAFERAMDAAQGGDYALSIQMRQKKAKGSAKRINGVHINGKSALVNGQTQKPTNIHVQKYSPMLVNAAIGLCTEMILSKGVALSDVIFDDVVRLLKRLINTGYVSLRKSLPPIAFARLLRILMRKESTHLSATQLMENVLKHINDVTEYHMVTMIQFYLRRTTRAGNTNEWKETARFLDQLVLYSGINEALYRSAARELLSHQEIQLLLRLLVLKLSGRCSLKSESQSGAYRSRIIQLIGLLSEHVSMPSEDLNWIRSSIRVEIKRTESLVTLKRLVDRNLSSMPLRTGDEKPTSATNQHPPYKIERITF